MTKKTSKIEKQASKPAELKDKALDDAQGAGTTSSTSTTDKGFWDGVARPSASGWAGKDSK